MNSLLRCLNECSPLWAGDMALTAPPRLPPSLLPVSRRISGLLHGDYSGLLHRAGSEIGDTRRYMEGDDVRRIDWPATARTVRFSSNVQHARAVNIQCRFHFPAK